MLLPFQFSYCQQSIHNHPLSEPPWTVSPLNHYILVLEVIVHTEHWFIKMKIFTLDSPSLTYTSIGLPTSVVPKRHTPFFWVCHIYLYSIESRDYLIYHRVTTNLVVITVLQDQSENLSLYRLKFKTGTVNKRHIVTHLMKCRSLELKEQTFYTHSHDLIIPTILLVYPVLRVLQKQCYGPYRTHMLFTVTIIIDNPNDYTTVYLIGRR